MHCRINLPSCGNITIEFQIVGQNCPENQDPHSWCYLDWIPHDDVAALEDQDGKLLPHGFLAIRTLCGSRVDPACSLNVESAVTINVKICPSVELPPILAFFGRNLAISSCGTTSISWCGLLGPGGAAGCFDASARRIS